MEIRASPGTTSAQYNSWLMTPNDTLKAARKKKTSTKAKGPITLAIDIGGSGLKAMLISPTGAPLTDRVRVTTPAIPTPRAVLAELDKIVAGMPGFNRVSVGFPGVVKRGTTLAAFNLHPLWSRFPLQAELERRWKKPARVANDSAVQGFGAINGKGVEMIITLGTGMGNSLFTWGRLCPGLELGHHPWKKYTYEDYIGRRGLDKYGKKRWNKYLEEVIAQTAETFNWDHLYLGGGNTKKIEFKLPQHVTVVSNDTGLLGGVALWKDETLSNSSREVRGS